MEIYTSENTELKCKIKSGIITRIDFPNTNDFYNLGNSKILSINIELPKSETDYNL